MFTNIGVDPVPDLMQVHHSLYPDETQKDIVEDRLEEPCWYSQRLDAENPQKCNLA